MSKTSVVRFTGTAVGVGTSTAEVTLTSPSAPPIRGFIHGHKIEMSGPATTVALTVKEGSGGDSILAYSAESLPFNKPSIPIWFQLSSGEDLVFEITTDDGTDSTTVTLTIEIEIM